MTYWIGRVNPSIGIGTEYWHQMLPPDVRLAMLTLGVRRLVGEQLERAYARILEQVEALDQEGMDVINIGGSPVVTAHGREGHDELLERIRRVTARPVVTSLQAEMEGLRAVGAGRVVIASPYPTALTEQRASILQDEGFDVVGHTSLDVVRNMDIMELEPEAVYRQAVDAAEAHPEADAIYMPCGALPVVGIMRPIEEATGKPVVANAQAQLAACLRRVQYGKPVTGFGQLLEMV